MKAGLNQLWTSQSSFGQGDAVGLLRGVPSQAIFVERRGVEGGEERRWISALHSAVVRVGWVGRSSERGLGRLELEGGRVMKEGVGG